MNLQGATPVKGAVLRPSTDEEFGDIRQDEIVLNHALAKSSNVTTPEADAQSSVTSSNLSATPDIKPAVPAQLPAKTPKPTIEVIDLEDDFFAMNYPPPPIVERKKKKKRVRRDKVSRQPSLDARVTSPTKEPSYTSLSPTPTTTDEPKRKALAPGDAEVIVLTDEEEESSQKQWKRPRKFSPIPFDDEEYRRKFQEMAKRQLSETESIDPTFDDYEDKELSRSLQIRRRMNQRILAKTPMASRASSLDSNSLDESNDPPRRYALHITSFLPGSENTAVKLTLKGPKKFVSVIAKVLKYLVDLGVVQPHYEHLYSPDNVQLLWNDMKISEYMKPDGLNIPDAGGETLVKMSLYTRSQVALITREKEQVRKQRLEKIRRDEELDRLARAQAAKTYDDDESQTQNDDLFKDIDKDIQEEDAKEGSAPPPPTQKSAEPEDDDSAEGYFKIVLKGADNKKTTVSVNAETKISKLVSYYLSKKSLPASTKVRLVFDEEDLPLTDTVGDTELEEDVMVEVYTS